MDHARDVARGAFTTANAAAPRYPCGLLASGLIPFCADPQRGSRLLRPKDTATRGRHRLTGPYRHVLLKMSAAMDQAGPRRRAGARHRRSAPGSTAAGGRVCRCGQGTSISTARCCKSLAPFVASCSCSGLSLWSCRSIRSSRFLELSALRDEAALLLLIGSALRPRPSRLRLAVRLGLAEVAGLLYLEVRLLPCDQLLQYAGIKTVKPKSKLGKRRSDGSHQFWRRQRTPSQGYDALISRSGPATLDDHAPHAASAAHWCCVRRMRNANSQHQGRQEAARRADTAGRCADPDGIGRQVFRRSSLPFRSGKSGSRIHRSALCDLAHGVCDHVGDAVMPGLSVRRHISARDAIVAIEVEWTAAASGDGVANAVKKCRAARSGRTITANVLFDVHYRRQHSTSSVSQSHALAEISVRQSGSLPTSWRPARPFAEYDANATGI